VSTKRHFRRSAELPFLASERERVTIILGGLTWKHERLIQAVLLRNGYRAECLAQPDRDAHEIGKEYCASGLCNPVYFVTGSLIARLRELEAQGMSRAAIVNSYLYFTAGSGGPCRFGMYESEIRSALNAAGFPGFRVVVFQQEHGVNSSSGQAGLQFSVDFGLGALHALVLGDLLNELDRKLSAYAIVPRAADRATHEITEKIASFLENQPCFDLVDKAPRRLGRFLQAHRESAVFRTCNTLCKVYVHLRAQALREELIASRQVLAGVRVDWSQLRPMVKVIGEFWAQLTEGDGNFRMFRFLEGEGAEVSVEPISCWVLYLLFQHRRRLLQRLELLRRETKWWQPSGIKLRAANFGKRLLCLLAERIYQGHYSRLGEALGNAAPLLPQETLAALATPHYNTGLHGGEGHLEVAKNLYYFGHGKSHMVLALKPFGCLPSQQSDAVQASLVERNPGMNFLSVETAGDGEIHARNRVQMAVSDAMEAARREFDALLSSTRLTPGDIRRYQLAHPEVGNARHTVERHSGVASTAGNFLLEVAAETRGTSPDEPVPAVRGKRSTCQPVSTLASNQEADNV
jgi:predicted nucleotide-binding protein (sugar kinase/HSP70/actin superfamily)